MNRRICLLAALALAGCAGRPTLSAHQPDGALEAGELWALLPLLNHTDTPQAALAAETLVEHALRLRGISRLVRYPAAMGRDGLFEPAERRLVDEAQKWAQQQGARYGVTGAVEEWRYKVGLDGEPVVGLTLRVLDLKDGRVVWTASGAQAGWARDSLAGVAARLLAGLTETLALRAGGPVR